MKTCLGPTPLGLEPSFGFGDRLGLSTPGHLAALREAGGSVRGIFAQQSIRELTRTGKTPEEVVQAACDAIAADDYEQPWSADADHLKTPDDIRRTSDAGFVFFTLDPSDDVDQCADSYNAAELAEKFAAIRPHAPWIERYRGQTVRLDAGSITFDDATITRAAVKYAQAVIRATKLANCVAEAATRCGRPHEIEMSLDETPEPTTPAEHYIVADQLREAGVALVSLAPRFVGHFEKGIEYQGDLNELAATLKIHAEIARRLGPYKLSLHSGSDKLSIYGLLARATAGRFHVKTSGTSYLEALRVAARYEPRLFREIVAHSRRHFDRDKATYCVSATTAAIPAPEAVDDSAELERIYLQCWDDVPTGRGFTALGRQILHCTFGSVLSDPRLGPELTQVIQDHPDEYREILRQHFVRHLRPLQTG